MPAPGICGSPPARWCPPASGRGAACARVSSRCVRTEAWHHWLLQAALAKLTESLDGDRPLFLSPYVRAEHCHQRGSSRASWKRRGSQTSGFALDPLAGKAPCELLTVRAGTAPCHADLPAKGAARGSPGTFCPDLAKAAAAVGVGPNDSWPRAAHFTGVAG